MMRRGVVVCFVLCHCMDYYVMVWLLVVLFLLLAFGQTLRINHFCRISLQHFFARLETCQVVAVSFLSV